MGQGRWQRADDFSQFGPHVTGNTRMRRRHLQRLRLYRTDLTMLWTILIILAIIALVLFILARVRGRRGV